MTSRHIIGLGYKAHAGKDTAAQFFGKKFTRIAFANALKNAAREIFGLSEKQMYDTHAKECRDPFWGDTPRRILQVMGTDCMKRYRSDIWIKALERRLPRGHVVITDVRFPREAAWIKRQGGYLWRIDRSHPEGPYSSHTSETAMEDYVGWDRIIDNNGSLVELEDQIRDAVSELLGEHS